MDAQAPGRAALTRHFPQIVEGVKVPGKPLRLNRFGYQDGEVRLAVVRSIQIVDVLQLVPRYRKGRSEEHTSELQSPD